MRHVAPRGLVRPGRDRVSEAANVRRAERGTALDPELLKLLPDTAAVTGGGHLSLAGCDVVDLAAEFGTPLYVYDEATIRQRAAAYRDGLRAAYDGQSLVCYAG